MLSIRDLFFGSPWTNPAERCPGVDQCPSVIFLRKMLAERPLQGQDASEQERQKLSAYKKELLAKADMLEKWQASLKEREQALEAREKAMQAQEDRRAAALQEAADRYKWERERWEAARPQPVRDNNVVLERADAVKGAFLGVNKELVEAKEKLVELIKAVNCCDQDGVKRLCELYREMILSRDPFAMELGDILQTQFQAEALEPCPGDAFDPVCHERLDASRPGEFVSCCRARGWRRMGEVLVRAVVEISERREFV